MGDEADVQRDRKREPHWRTGTRGHDVIDLAGGDFCHAPGAHQGQYPRSLQEKTTNFSWTQLPQRSR
jgi:hypothetical protein